jgi:hypothetical protein
MQERTRLVTFEPTANGVQCPALWSEQLCNTAPCVQVELLLQNETQSSFEPKQTVFVRAFAAAIDLEEGLVDIVSTSISSSSSSSSSSDDRGSLRVELSIASSSDAHADTLVATISATGFDQQLVDALRSAGYPGAETMTASAVTVDSVGKETSPDHADVTAELDTGDSAQAKAKAAAIVAGVLVGLLFAALAVYAVHRWRGQQNEFTEGGARKVTKKASYFKKHSLDRHTEANASSLTFEGGSESSTNPLHARSANPLTENGDHDMEAIDESYTEEDYESAGNEGVNLPGSSSSSSSSKRGQADGSGRGMRTESVQSAMDPSSGKEYFYNVHTQKTGWSAEEVSRKGVNDSFGLGSANGDGGAFSGQNPLSKGGSGKEKKGGKLKGGNATGREGGSDGAGAKGNREATKALRTESVAEARDPSTGKPYFYNVHTQKTGWSAEEVSRKGVNDSFGISSDGQSGGGSTSARGGDVGELRSLSNPMHAARNQGMKRVESNLTNKAGGTSDC